MNRLFLCTYPLSCTCVYQLYMLCANRKCRALTVLQWRCAPLDHHQHTLETTELRWDDPFDSCRIDILITTSTSKCFTLGKSVCIHNEPLHYNWTGVVANPDEMTLSRRGGGVGEWGRGRWGVRLKPMMGSRSFPFTLLCHTDEEVSGDRRWRPKLFQFHRQFPV